VKLTDQQAEQIKLILSVVQGGDDAVTRIRDLVVQDTKAYLDIALVNALWDQWELDKAFDFEVTSGSSPTHTVKGDVVHRIQYSLTETSL
jgi:hypothetical protein